MSLGVACLVLTHGSVGRLDIAPRSALLTRSCSRRRPDHATHACRTFRCCRSSTCIQCPGYENICRQDKCPVGQGLGGCSQASIGSVPTYLPSRLTTAQWIECSSMHATRRPKSFQLFLFCALRCKKRHGSPDKMTPRLFIGLLSLAAVAAAQPALDARLEAMQANIDALTRTGELDRPRDDAAGRQRPRDLRDLPAGDDQAELERRTDARVELPADLVKRRRRRRPPRQAAL